MTDWVWWPMTNSNTQERQEDEKFKASLSCRWDPATPTPTRTYINENGSFDFQLRDLELCQGGDSESKSTWLRSSVRSTHIKCWMLRYASVKWEAKTEERARNSQVSSFGVLYNRRNKRGPASKAGWKVCACTHIHMYTLITIIKIIIIFK